MANIQAKIVAYSNTTLNRIIIFKYLHILLHLGNIYYIQLYMIYP